MNSPELAPEPADVLNETLMTVAEVAALWRVSNMTVYRLVKSGELPAVRIGRAYRLKQSAVRAFETAHGHGVTRGPR